MLDFSQYDLIIDARSPREYTEDHIPGAVNLPVVNNEEYAEVGTMHKTDTHRAYQIGVAYSMRNIARYLPEHIDPLPKSARILVYCFRGGKRSTLWYDPLRTIGYQVEKVAGGWKEYRRWVNLQLAEFPLRFHFHVLCGPTGVGKTRLLLALREVGAQVLDLEELAQHRGSVIGAIPGISQPSQKMFDSLVLRELQTFDINKPVWIEAESKKIGALQVPRALFETMIRGSCYSMSAPMNERLRVWREDYRHFEEDPSWLMDRLKYLRPLVGSKEFEEWETLAKAKQMPALFVRLMEKHYDPAYAKSISKNYQQMTLGVSVELTSLDPDSLRMVAAELHDNKRGTYFAERSAGLENVPQQQATSDAR